MTARTVVTVGTFDGVHQGHRAIADEIARRARTRKLRSVIVTFDPHPLEVINPPAAPPLLTLTDEKRAILATLPVDEAVFVPFTEELRNLPPERFVRDVLEARFHIAELVIGHDHGFGRDRKGDVELLRAIGKQDGFAVDVVEPVLVDGRPVSSTMIRRAVAGGDLATAERALGRPYGVTGRVMRGEGRGRTLGVPTVNVEPPPPRKLLPPDGVYACAVSWEGHRHGAMASLGARPTFGDARRTLEAHVFAHEGDLYGRAVTVEFVHRLRDIEKFASAEALAAAMAKDKGAALAALRMWGQPVTL